MISTFARAGLLALVLAASLATSADAGVSYWGGPNCADVTTLPSHFTGSYAGNDKCTAMCRAAADVCRSSVKRAIACNQGESAGYWTTWALANCAPLTGAEKNACLHQVKLNRASDKTLLKGWRDTGISDCDDFLASCITGCSAM